jgi:XRN 5'-3' exonuclease N-terminus
MRPALRVTCKHPQTAVRTEEAYFHKLFRSLDHALSLARPQKSVLLALDGPAPLAKLLLQRWGPRHVVQVRPRMLGDVWRHSRMHWPEGFVSLACAYGRWMGCTLLLGSVIVGCMPMPKAEQHAFEVE